MISRREGQDFIKIRCRRGGRAFLRETVNRRNVGAGFLFGKSASRAAVVERNVRRIHFRLAGIKKHELSRAKRPADCGRLEAARRIRARLRTRAILEDRFASAWGKDRDFLLYGPYSRLFHSNADVWADWRGTIFPGWKLIYETSFFMLTIPSWSLSRIDSTEEKYRVLDAKLLPAQFSDERT